MWTFSSCRRFAVCIACLFHVATFAGRALANDPVDFNRQIRPLLSDRCYQCHGPDESGREADLRLDASEYALSVIEPGDVAQSELVARIASDDPDFVMPPPESGKTLDAKEIAVLKQWVSEGAEYQLHWAFVAPKRGELPETKNSEWPAGAIDRFVLAKLEGEGLAPSTEADRITLLRRVTFDLIGLPPTREEAQVFLANESPEAFEHVVDRLLASPRYGEHMARYWLDAARYGDTHGLHLDNYREMWPYRDAVVRAMNDNMPWDQFVVKSLAGDLLPEASLEDQVLSGFNRCHISTNEGGSIAEEVYVRNVVDRVSTTGTVFLGLTMGCAVCHDHKFDPITSKDFYSSFAYFNNLEANPMDGNAAQHPPVVRVPSTQQRQQQAEHEEKLAGLESKAKGLLTTVLYEEPEFSEADRSEFVWIDDELPAGADVGDSEKAHGPWKFVGKPDHPVHSGERSMARTADGLSQHYFTGAEQGLRVGAGDTFFAYVYLDPANPPNQIMLQWHTDGWKHRAYWGANQIEWGLDGTASRRHLGEMPATGKWVRLEVDAELVGVGAGSIVSGWAFTQFGGTVYWDKSGLVTGTSQGPTDFVWIDDNLPTDAKPGGDGTTWQTVSSEEHPVYQGQRSLRRSMGDGLNQDFFTGAKPLVLSEGDKLFAHVYLDPNDPPKSVQLQFNNGNWEHRARWGTPAHGSGRAGGADFVASKEIPELGKWVRLEVPLASVGLKAGDALNGWAFTQVGGTVYWDAAGVSTLNAPDQRYLHSLAIWIQRAQSDDSLPEPVRQAAQGNPGGRTEQQDQTLRDYYVQWIWAASRNDFNPVNVDIEQTKKAIEAVKQSAPTTLVMRERAKPKPAFLLKRGEYDQPDKDLGPMPRAVPSFLPPLPQGAPNNRLGYAQWLVDPAHPLLARVTVNRFWQQCFGLGIVETAGDFGAQGSWPSHQGLLDFLAVEFLESDWDVKQMMKRIVMSNTYRQSSRTNAHLVARDPRNRMLAHGPRFRLDAEVLRDQALSVSGLLRNELGGPGVKPPQPSGIWSAVAYSGSNTKTFVADKGSEKVHRRSLYTFWKRTAPAPQMTTLDGPSRESCVVKRERTNTPLQALLLLNDPQFVEAARKLANRAMEESAGEGTSSPADVAATMFQIATLRVPEDEELAILVATYEASIIRYKGDLDAAGKLLSVGEAPTNDQLDRAESAAWTLVANAVLNLDEVVTKE